MLREECRKIALVLILFVLWLSLPTNQALAMPSFGRQTGLGCNSCHTIYPELTPTGRNFKMNGYTATKHEDKPYEWPPPITASIVTSFTHLNRKQPVNTLELNNKANDNVNLPQELSVAYAGRIVPYVGAIIQGTYDVIENKFLIDQHTDIRPSVKTEVGGKDLVLGITLNNTPGTQDVLNTIAFNFPWLSSETNLAPAARTILEGGLARQVGGTGVYAYWNNLLYGEVSLYRTARTGPHQLLGAGSVTETRVDGLTPYWRVFAQRQWGKHSLAVGHIGLITRIFPEKEAEDAQGREVPNLQRTSGPSDKFTDIAFDAQYQYIGKKHIFTGQTIWITEFQHFQANNELGNTQNANNRLNTYKLNLNYYYRTDKWGTLGATWAFFSTWGSKDQILYAPSPGDGNRTGKPNTNGFILEASYLPWKYTKITIQYTIFNKFNGASSNYDGFRRNAADNNTLFIALWGVI